MPFGGPEEVVTPPPLVAPPTGLLQSVTVIEHPLLESAGYLAKMVGPDAPDTILASVIMQAASRMFPESIDTDQWSSPEYAVKAIDGLSFDQREQLRTALLSEVSEALVAAPQGGMEMGGKSDQPFDHWLAGIRWLPENVLPLELFDPCNDGGGTFIDYAASGATGVSRKPSVAGQPFGVNLHDSCSTYGWKDADYVGRATRGLSARETWHVEREFMHGDFMGAARVIAADGHSTSGSNAITSATGEFTQADVGKRITSSLSGIPANTFIGTVTDNTHATLSSSATSNVTVNATANQTIAVFTIAGRAGGSNRFLADANAHILTGVTDPTPIQALAYANEAIARANIGQGMIHVSAFFLEIVAAGGYAFEKDARGRLRTPNGNIIVPGNGYDGVGPDGTGGSVEDGSNDSGHSHEWIYATDVPVIWRPPQPDIFPTTLREATRMTKNEVTFRAQRAYVIAWSALLQTAIKCKIV